MKIINTLGDPDWISWPGDGTVLCHQTTSSHRGTDSADRDVQNLFGTYSLKPSTDKGHEFFTEKQSFKTSHGLVHMSGKRTDYYGPLGHKNRAAAYENSFYPLPNFSSSDVNFYGAKAISNSIPTKSAASLAQFLGELREGLPSMVGLTLLKGSGRPGSIGSEYLNFQFGLKPLFNDLKKFANAARNSSRIIKQYEHDSGRVVRRSRGLSGARMDTNDETTLESPYGFDNIGIPSYGIGGGPSMWVDQFQADGGRLPLSVQRNYHVKRRVWFSGAFSYYLNNGDDVIDRFDRYEQLANKLLGTRLTLDVLYQLTPWSWLLDWFADVGDVITNASAFASDRLVMRYGYLMVHTTSRAQFSSSLTDPSGKRISYANEFVTDRKQRFRASPYGFGLNPESFSNSQWAILGALGMTKGPRSLR